jgi:hypothetical protein
MELASEWHILVIKMLSPLAKTARVNRKKISVIDLHDSGDEVRFWRRQSARKRLEALELLRQSAHAYDPDTARIPRCSIIIRSRNA